MYEKKFIYQCYDLYNLIKYVDGDHDILEQLLIVGCFIAKDDKILIFDDKDNKKKMGAISAVAKNLNLKLDKDAPKWEGLFENDNFILRREYYHETDEILLKKLSNSLDEGFKVFFCIGESLNDRENDLHFDVIEQQLKNTIFKIDKIRINYFKIK